MLIYLVLFAAVALKMRSSTFRGTSFTIRVELKQILGHGVSGSLSSTGNVTYAERSGEAFGGNTQCKGAPAHIVLSLFRTL